MADAATATRRAKYKPYPAYKPSGVEWLGGIPEGWEVQRLKYLAKIRNGQDYKSVETREGIPVYGSGGAFTFASTCMYDKASVLLGRKGTIDKPLFVDHPFWTVDTMYYTEVDESTPPKFLYYLAMTIQFGRYSTNTALPSMTQEHLGNYYFSTPNDPSEQIQIAAFLDHETTRIDALIAKQQRLIALLEEKRQAVISHAVTKGLNPNAPLRPSGIDWLGDVPAHWGMKRVKHVCAEIIDCKNRTPEQKDDGQYFVVRTTSIRDGKFNLAGGYYTDRLSYEEWTQRGVPTVGDVLFTREAPTGEACLAPSDLDFCLGQRTMALRPDQSQMLSEYLLLNIYGPLVRDEIAQKSKGSTVGHLRVGEVGNLPCLVPPFDEQRFIFSEVGKIQKLFDQLFSDAQSAIALLKERRTALISAAVTGKIDLRDWQPPASLQSAPKDEAA